MKSIYKLKFHPLFYLLAFICIITGLFKNFIIFMLIILIHESGHIIAGLLLKQKIEKVIILPFGGITIFNMMLNIELYKEFIIAISGPMVQILFFVLGHFFIHDVKFYNYNLLILVFNLIPIYPLDGSKILNIIVSFLFSFKNAFIIMMIISILLVIFLIITSVFTNINLFLIIVLFFLLIKIIMEVLNYKNIYNKFLFERYYYNLSFSKLIYIGKISDFHKNKRHMVKEGKIYITEKEILRKRFDFQRNI